MAELIELKCDKCGKLVKVNKKRAGQTGRCSRCKASITIPFPKSDKPDIIRAEKGSSSKAAGAGDFAADFASLRDGGKGEWRTAIRSAPQESASIPDESRSETWYTRQYQQNEEAVPAQPTMNAAEQGAATATLSPKKKKQFIALLVGIFFFGALVGLLLGPGYLKLIPAKEKWGALFASSKSTPTLPKPIPVDVGKEESDDDDDFAPTKPEDNAKKDPAKEAAVEKSKTELEGAIERIEGYLDSMQKSTRELSKTRDSLAKESVPLMDVEQALQEADGWRQALVARADFAKRVIRHKKWDKLEEAHSNLKDHRAWGIEIKTNVIPKLDKASQKASELYQQILKQKGSMVSGAKYMGDWYKNLTEELAKLKKIADQNPGFENKGAGVRFDTIKTTVIKMENYEQDIAGICETLEKTQKSKDVQAWIEKRKNATMPNSREQGKALEEFLRNKKFEVEIAEDIDALRSGIPSLASEAEDGKLSESTVKSVLRVLQKIERKYDEAQQTFNAAVTAFQYS